MAKKETNHPVWSARSGSIQTALFEWKKKDEKGGKSMQKSIKFQKNRKDRETKKWENDAIFLTPFELLHLLLVVLAACFHCLLTETYEQKEQ